MLLLPPWHALLCLVLSPHRRFGKQTLRRSRAILDSSLAANYCAWLAQLPQCPHAPHSSHTSPEGPDHDAALLPGGEGEPAGRRKGEETFFFFFLTCSRAFMYFKFAVFITDNLTCGLVGLLHLKFFPPFLQTPRKRKTRHSSNPPMECHVGWVMDSREHRSRTASVRWPSPSHSTLDYDLRFNLEENNILQEEGKIAEKSLFFSACPSAPTPARLKAPRSSATLAARLSPYPSSSTPHTNCLRRTASRSTSTTSTAGAA